MLIRGSTLFGFVLLTMLFLEIAVLIFVESKVGILATFFLLFLAVYGGIFLLHKRREAFFHLQVTCEEGHMYIHRGSDEIFLIISAILLILPGFLSDIVGLVLLIPQIRMLILYCICKNVINTVDNRKMDNFVETKIFDLDSEHYSSINPQKSPWRKP